MPSVVRDYPKSRYIFLTLTVKNCPVTELRQAVKLMNNAWSKLTRRKNFPAIGFVRSLEVTRGKDGTAHPHFHALLMVTPSYFTGRQYLSQKAWTELWQSCLKVDYNPVVNVKKVKPKKGVDVAGEVDALVPAICETLKYSVKTEDLVADPEWLEEITRQLHKTRAISVGGILKEYLSEDDPDDLIHGDLEPEDDLENAPKLIFDWAEIVKRYAARKTR
jgi:plasmid rolling circle replication initiator protein Rep